MIENRFSKVTNKQKSKGNKRGKTGENANFYEEAVIDQVTHLSAFLVGTLSLVSYAEANIVATNRFIWELNLQDILL
jgi:hypothetical protein